MTAKIFIPATRGGWALEFFETAEALGMEPLSLYLPSEGTTPRSDQIILDDSFNVTPDMMFFPVMGQGAYGDRFDRRWRSRTEWTVKQLTNRGIESFANLIHPSASVSPSVTLGEGVFVGPNATIASAARVGNFAQIGRSSSIGHHVVLSQYVRLGPAVVIPSGVRLSSGVTVGPGVIFLNNIRVGSNALVGAGSVVTKNVPDETFVVGSPARKHRKAWKKSVRRRAKAWRRRLSLRKIRSVVGRRSRQFLRIVFRQTFR